IRESALSIARLLFCIAHRDQRRGSLGVVGNFIKSLASMSVFAAKCKNGRELRQRGGAACVVLDRRCNFNRTFRFSKSGKLRRHRAKESKSRLAVARLHFALRTKYLI